MWGFISAEFDIDLPWQSFTAGHSTPFDFIADAYFERYAILLAQGPRGGGKTRIFSILDVASMRFKPGIEIVAIAGSEDQVRKGYTYVSGKRATAKMG